MVFPRIVRDTHVETCLVVTFMTRTQEEEPNQSQDKGEDCFNSFDTDPGWGDEGQ